MSSNITPEWLEERAKSIRERVAYTDDFKLVECYYQHAHDNELFADTLREVEKKLDTCKEQSANYLGHCQRLNNRAEKAEGERDILREENIQLRNALNNYLSLFSEGIKEKHLSHVSLPHGWNGFDDTYEAIEFCKREALSALFNQNNNQESYKTKNLDKIQPYFDDTYIEDD